MADDQATAYLGHVRALIETARSRPGDAETEHTMVTELFPGFVAAVEAALEAASRWEKFSTGHDAQAECASELRRVIAGELLSKEGRHG
jgi:hypothetical protein